MDMLGSKSSLEDQMKTLKNHFGRIVATVKDLKSSIDDLKQKCEVNLHNEVKEIMETQRVMDEVVVSNSDALHKLNVEFLKMKCAKEPLEAGTKENIDILNKEIERGINKRQEGMDKSIARNTDTIKLLDKEIKSISKDKNSKEINKKEIDDAIDNLNKEIKQIHREKKDTQSTEEALTPNGKKKDIKKCKYFNTGYCKYKTRCRFTHPEEVCKKVKCDGKECPDRHPRQCKWVQRDGGCRRINYCAYSHNISEACAVKTYKCISCKYKWREEKFVVKHRVENMEVHFCLNCDDWVKQKSKVLDLGWSLFDQDGNLKYDL